MANYLFTDGPYVVLVSFKTLLVDVTESFIILAVKYTTKVI